MSEEILLISDTHCQFDVLEKIVAHELQRNPQIKAILHCGDLGIYDSENLSTVSQRERYLIQKHNNPVHLFKPYLAGMRTLPLPTYAICGNHEDFVLADELAAKQKKIANLQIFSPGDITRIAIGSKSLQVMGLGKILPVGCKKKRARYIQEEELAKAIRKGRSTQVDILLSHEAILLQRNSGGIFGSLELSELVEEIRPYVFIAGHMHFEYTHRVEDTQIYGLGYGLAGRYAVMDEHLSVVFKSLPEQPVDLIPVCEVDKKHRQQITAEKKSFALAKKRSVCQKFPVTGKEIIQKLQLVFGAEVQKLVSLYFVELKAKLVDTPDMSKEQALALCERFIRSRL